MPLSLRIIKQISGKEVWRVLRNKNSPLDMKKLFSVCMMLMMVMALMLTPALANEVGSGVASDGSNTSAVVTDPGTETTGSGGGYQTEGVMDPQDAAGIPNVSTDELIDRIDSKGNDVVNILQAVGKWACIVIFIVCIILFIIGLIGNKRMAVAAFIGMLCAGIGYAGILCGREIVSFIASWAAS